ncbi:MAG: SprT family zinc-dependent metalloprotease [Novosphingobium sp.]
MLDWLRRDPREVPHVAVGERLLPLDLRRRAQATRLTMRLSPDGSAVVVTMPRWGRTAEALAFARSRADWLARQLAAIPAAPILADGMILRYRGADLRLRHDPAARRRVQVADGELLVGGPADTLSARLSRWLKAEASALFAAELSHYCALADRPVPRLALSGAQRRWGSCSAKGDIRINWRLIMAPDHVRRSVLAHEVAHLVHFNHSPQFHALVDALFEGDLPEADRWLKREGRSLYAPFG